MRAPVFWSKNTWVSRLLIPFGAVYGYATALRLARAPSYRAPVPVICVGNVTAGGSGKTPVVQALAKQASARGIAVHCLTRGYGGKVAGPVRVDPDIHTAHDVGDEPLLLAASAPTWVARDRAAGARAAIAAGAKLLLLDDGLQNPSLTYDLPLLVIDGGFGFGNGRLIPAGPLREMIMQAAARCGAAILIGPDETGSLSQLPPTFPIIHARIVAKENDLSGHKVVAFAGLGRPEKFRRTLIDIGAEIAVWKAFPDHHEFTAADLDFLSRKAEQNSARLVTTEKDFVRLPLAFRKSVTALGIALVADESDAFDRLLDRVLT